MINLRYLNEINNKLNLDESSVYDDNDLIDSLYSDSSTTKTRTNTKTERSN